MKVILKVARTELNTLFYSPIAWFLLIVFWIQCGFTYFNLMEFVTRQTEMSGDRQEFYTSITTLVYLSPMGFFKSVMDNLYLYVPLLTMSLFSREISSGTIKLLYSSPVSMTEIVLGKYLAMLIYSLLLVITVGMFMVSGILNIQNVDTGVLLTGLLGFYLLLCAYSAIGLFMSSLTGYLVVAAVSTFVTIGVLSYIGRLWQDVNIVRELTYYLSISGRTQNMLSGLITTKDLLYFLVVVYMFLGLTIYKLKAGMESRSKLSKALRYAAIVVSALIFGYFTSIPGLVGYWDTTAKKTKTLTPQVQKILKDLGDEPLEVTAYVNILDRFQYLGSPSSANANKSRWEPYQRFKNNIILKNVMYYDSSASLDMQKRFAGKSMKEVAEHYAKTLNIGMDDLLTPEEIRKLIDLRSENNRYVMHLKWKDRTTFLRVFDDLTVWPSEAETAAALLRLQQATLPKIAFINSELERDINKSGDRDYKGLTNTPSYRHSFVNQGFDITTLSLESGEISTDISVLVLADPLIGLSDQSISKLCSYIEKGGNLLIAGEPGKQDILNPVLASLGVELEQGIIINESKDNLPTFVTAYVQKEAGDFYKPLAKHISNGSPVTMPGAASINFKTNGEFSAIPLVKTDPDKSWLRKNPLNSETMIRASVVASNDSLGTVTFNAHEGDRMGPLTTMIALVRKAGGKEQRIIVSGDADFLSNKELSSNRSSANFIFSTALFRWTSGGQFPIETTRPEENDKKLNTNLKKLKFEKTLFLWICPAILLVVGTITLIRRKRK
ncbi:MAG TPA: Gldg family protein [Parasegetibacter sp.]